jgi:type IV secretory pathway TraG/TraD family ATPase VirD4
VRRLPEDEALIYVAGCAPIRVARVPYWRDPELARRAAIPPPAGPEPAAAGNDGRPQPVEAGGPPGA